MSTPAGAFSSLNVGSVVQPCKLAKNKPWHWIEIRLLGEDDQPIPWEQYRLTLPDGEVVRGFLDAKGAARVDMENPGMCKVEFPMLDRDAWSYIDTVSS